MSRAHATSHPLSDETRTYTLPRCRAAYASTRQDKGYDKRDYDNNEGMGGLLYRCPVILGE